MRSLVQRVLNIRLRPSPREEHRGGAADESSFAPMMGVSNMGLMRALLAIGLFLAGGLFLMLGFDNSMDLPSTFRFLATAVIFFMFFCTTILAGNSQL